MFGLKGDALLGLIMIIGMLAVILFSIVKSFIDDKTDNSRRPPSNRSPTHRPPERPTPPPVTNEKKEYESIEKLRPANSVCVYELICPEFVDMIWFYNGTHKNYEPDTRYPMDPSMIDETLPIIRNQTAEPLSYFPKYGTVPDEQRGKYIDFLSTPALNTNDIGYVFVFYYGLERHLCYGNFDKAFDLIMFLREKYDNRSFLTYSATALILSAIKHNRQDRLQEFFESLDLMRDRYINVNLLIYGKIKSGSPLTSLDIVAHSKDFKFSNKSYINDYPDKFMSEMDKFIKDRYYNCIPIQTLEMDFYDEYKSFSFYANQSLYELKIDIPIYTNFINFVEDIHDLLQQTQDKIKLSIKQGKVK